MVVRKCSVSGCAYKVEALTKNFAKKSIEFHVMKAHDLQQPITNETPKPTGPAIKEGAEEGNAISGKNEPEEPPPSYENLLEEDMMDCQRIDLLCGNEYTQEERNIRQAQLCRQHKMLKHILQVRCNEETVLEEANKMVEEMSKNTRILVEREYQYLQKYSDERISEHNRKEELIRLCGWVLAMVNCDVGDIKNKKKLQRDIEVLNEYVKKLEELGETERDTGKSQNEDIKTDSQPNVEVSNPEKENETAK